MFNFFLFTAVLTLKDLLVVELIKMMKLDAFLDLKKTM